MKKSLIISLFTAILFIFFNSVIFAKELVIVGSTTVLPIVQTVAEAYMKEHPDVKISVSGGGSGVGIKSLIDGTCDIATSSRFIKFNEVKMAVDKKRYPVPFAIAYDCIVPIVNPSNPVSNISIEQLRLIYQGRIRNWKELGGPKKRIVVISRDTSSGTYEVWEEKVMKKSRVYPGALLQASNGAVAQVVAKNKYAIGYIGIGYINKSVKPLKVNNIEANLENVLNGSYPITRPLFLFTNGWPKGEVLRFINFVLNPKKGQKFIMKIGFIPFYVVETNSH